MVVRASRLPSRDSDIGDFGPMALAPRYEDLPAASQGLEGDLGPGQGPAQGLERLQFARGVHLGDEAGSWRRFGSGLYVDASIVQTLGHIVAERDLGPHHLAHRCLLHGPRLATGPVS